MSTPEQLCRQFSLDEIKEATCNFDDELVIGKGGFRLVYIGSINNGVEFVAIKRLSSQSSQGETEFVRELETLSKLQHDNLVRLEGYCNESREKILVYEYMPNGTLVDHVYKKKGSATATGDNQPSPLTWEQRLNICIGAAKGLDYLHRGVVPGVIHRDIKGPNILLDSKFTAKIADFGLAKLVKPTTDPNITSVSTTVFKGTFGYVDPEYFYTQRLTAKTDIYAFGVVLLVTLSGRRALDGKVVEDQRNLAQWGSKCIEKNRLDRIIDPCLVRKISPSSLKQFVKVAHKCLCRQSEQRPTMEEVVAGLELALKKQPTSAASGEKFYGMSSVAQTLIAKVRIKMDKNQSDKQKFALSTTLAGCIYPRFSLDEIKKFTQNFSNCIRWGRFGNVYLGRINHGAEVVEIKCFSSETAFSREMGTLCKLQHDNVIRLKGYYYESSEKIIVYEYMAKGSLDKNLHCLSWEQRLKICLGVARGLDFLHREIEPGVIHRDVNCSNIMLDDNFVPKVSDFGVSVAGNSADGCIRFTNLFVSTSGYAVPEYMVDWGVTKKYDVFSFGVVLIVVLSGRPPSEDGMFKVKFKEYLWGSVFDRIRVNHVEWVTNCIRDNIMDKLIEPDLRGQFKLESLEKFLAVALNCLREQPEIRGTMEDVVVGLELALENQLDSTSSPWNELQQTPQRIFYQTPQRIFCGPTQYSMAVVKHCEDDEYSSELYDEFLKEYSEM